MTNITFSIPESLSKRMKKFPEIKWSVLYRQMINRYLGKLESPDQIPISDYFRELETKGLKINTENIELNQYEAFYKKMEKSDWERTKNIYNNLKEIE